MLFECETLALGQALAAREGAVVSVFTARTDGTHPKQRLVLKRPVSTNTTLAGGNANLMMIG